MKKSIAGLKLQRTLTNMLGTRVPTLRFNMGRLFSRTGFAQKGPVGRYLSRRDDLGHILEFLQADAGTGLDRLTVSLGSLPMNGHLTPAVLSEAYFLSGDRPSLEQLSRKYKDNPFVLLYIGVMHLAQYEHKKSKRDLTEALTHLRKAYRLHPRHGRIASTLSKALVHQGEYDEAVEVIDGLKEGGPCNDLAVIESDLMTLLLKGYIFTSTGRYDQADDKLIAALSAATANKDKNPELCSFTEAMAYYNKACLSALRYEQGSEHREREVVEDLQQALELERKNFISTLADEYRKDTRRCGVFEDLMKSRTFKERTIEYTHKRIVVVTEKPNREAAEKIVDLSLKSRYLCYLVTLGEETFEGYLPLMVANKKAHGVLFVVDEVEEANPHVRELLEYGLKPKMFVAGREEPTIGMALCPTAVCGYGIDPVDHPRLRDLRAAHAIDIVMDLGFIFDEKEK